MSVHSFIYSFTRSSDTEDLPCARLNGWEQIKSRTYKEIRNTCKKANAVGAKEARGGSEGGDVWEEVRCRERSDLIQSKGKVCQSAIATIML